MVPSRRAHRSLGSLAIDDEATRSLATRPSFGPALRARCYRSVERKRAAMITSRIRPAGIRSLT
jgi:hypothetical protein